jgi:predicted nucleic acid-binding protein
VILVDTSAWVDLLRGARNRTTDRLRTFLTEQAPVAITEPVVMELLSGCRSGHELAEVRRRLVPLELLPVGGLETWERASAVERVCAEAGQRVRNRFDCLIAAVAIREDASVLHRDRAFEVIARHTDLRVEPR